MKTSAQSGFDAIDLEVLWSQLITVVDECAYAILRTSTSKVVVESRDFGALLLDPDGELVACDAGVASKISTKSIAVSELLKVFPRDTLVPGDMLITNNPWWIKGHLNDVAVVAPLFHHGRLVGFAECMAHMSDIGETLSASPRELYEEGLIIPPLKVLEAGRENATFFALLQANVRVPVQIAGDVRGLIAGCRVMERELQRFLDDTGLPDLTELAGAITHYSREVMRTAIRDNIPDGSYHGETTIEGAGNLLHIKALVTVHDGDLVIDFDGSSPQLSFGVNSTLVYTHLWATFIIKALLCPSLPSNAGTFAPMQVLAPEGCFLNARFPAPVRLKSSSGHFVPDAIIEALKDALPNRVLAESGNLFVAVFAGTHADQRPYAESMFIMGGMGARAGRHGLDCIGFPANSSNMPVEVLETAIPVRVLHKRIRRDSGGAGKWHGGCGQEFLYECLSDTPMTVRASHGKLAIPPMGLQGGLPGKAGGIWKNGEPIADKIPVVLHKGDRICLQTPGSGGLGAPQQDV